MPKQVQLTGAALEEAREIIRVSLEAQKEVKALEAKIEARQKVARGDLLTIHGRIAALLGFPNCSCVRLDLTYLEDTGVALATLPDDCDANDKPKKRRLN